MSKGTAHILVFPFPIQSHINPMLQFAKRLALKGLRVTLITTNFISKSMQVQDSLVEIESISDGFDSGEKAESADAYMERFKRVLLRSLMELIEKQKSSHYPPKILVYDSSMSWALDVAQRGGLRGAPFFTQSCVVSAIYYHVHEGNLKVPLEVSTVQLPALPLLEIDDLPSFVSRHGIYPLILSILANQFSNIQKADWIFFNSFDKLEEEVLNWMANELPMIKTIGPTLPSVYLDKRLEGDKDYGLSLFKPSTEAYMKWLDTKKKSSVVYVSFGSIASIKEEQMAEVAQGLKNNGKSYFLWVVRASEESKLPTNFKEETKERGLIVNWCSQVEVLAHRAVGCFMTHCGWNSTLEALTLGVPMVAMPQWTDQTTNAKCIADVWNAGIRVKVNDKGIISREEIEHCIDEVLKGERGNELRRNVVKWKELAREATFEGGSSDKNIEEFVSQVLNIDL